MASLCTFILRSEDLEHSDPHLVSGESKLKFKTKRKLEKRERRATPEEDFPKLSPRCAPMGIVQGIVGICLH